LNSELILQNLAIVNPAAVTASFFVIQSSGGGGVNHDYRLRIYASEIQNPVPEPASALLLGAGMISLFIASRKNRRA
jgi:hypothetical protein